MTKKVYKIEKWIKEKIACWYDESQCEVPELPEQIIEGKILALKDMLSFIDSLQEEPTIAYVVTRCEEHSDYVEEVFFDKNKAQEYCDQFKGNEDAYARHITKVKVTL